MREVGYVMSGASHRLVPFVVKEGEKVSTNKHYFIAHPAKSDGSTVPVLLSVFKVMSYNPEMDCGQIGPVAMKTGEPVAYGKRLEYEIAWAEPLGYFSGQEWGALECAPSTRSPVFEANAEELDTFFTSYLKMAIQPYLVQVGRLRGSAVPVYLDLNAIAKGHLFVAGMTRSGKSSFVLNFVRESSNLAPRPSFVIFDRRGEYAPLAKYGALMLPYRCFLPKLSVLTGDVVAARLGLDWRRSAGRVVADAVESLREGGSEITRSSVWGRVEELVRNTVSRGREYVLGKVRWALDARGAFLDERWEALDIVSTVLGNPIVVVDLSGRADLDGKLLAMKHALRRLTEFAMERGEKGGFAAIVVVEEVQYYAPERGLNLEVGNPTGIGVDKQLIEAVSQAGGYNLGFIIVTQRPAYVSKSIISQCNTVACFRLMSGNDQEAVLQYTEHGNGHLRDFLPCLADHEALVWGMASPFPFPVVSKFQVHEYPKKASITAREAWGVMEEARKALGARLTLAKSA